MALGLAEKRTGDTCTRLTADQREELILRLMPLVYTIARRFLAALPADVALDDLVSAGTVGLIHAVDNYEHSFDVKLETYAGHRIRGSMLDSIRANDWLPRRQRAHLKRMQAAMAAAQAKHQRFFVTDEEVAEELGASVEEYREMLASLPVTRIVSLEEPGHQAENANSDARDEPLAVLEREQMSQLLQSALERLPKEEQLILSLYYQEGLSPQEVARVSGLPVKRVYQVRGQAVLRLRAALQRRLYRRTSHA